MTQQDQLKQIEELWDSLSPELKTIFSARFEYQKTIKNTSNASSYIDIKLFYENWKPLCDISSTSSHIQVLEEEVEEWCSYCGQSQKKHIGVCNDA